MTIVPSSLLRSRTDVAVIAQNAEMLAREAIRLGLGDREVGPAHQGGLTDLALPADRERQTGIPIGSEPMKSFAA